MSFRDPKKLRIVATKSYSAIGNAISGIPTGEAIDYMLPAVGMLTDQGLIKAIVVNGAGSGVQCVCAQGLSSSGYFYTDKLLVYSGVAAAAEFGWVGNTLVTSGGLVGHRDSAALAVIDQANQNIQKGWFGQASGPTSFSLPRVGNNE